MPPADLACSTTDIWRDPGKAGGDRSQASQARKSKSDKRSKPARRILQAPPIGSSYLGTENAPRLSRCLGAKSVPWPVPARDCPPDIRGTGRQAACTVFAKTPGRLHKHLCKVRGKDTTPARGCTLPAACTQSRKLTARQPSQRPTMPPQETRRAGS